MTLLTVRESKPASFVRATSHLVIGSLGAQLLVVATFAVIARGLGKPVFGLTVALLGAGAVAQDVLDFGTSQWLSRELAAGRLTGAAVRASLHRRAWLTRSLCVASVVVTALGRGPWLLVLAVAAYVTAAVDNAGLHARLRAAGRFRRSAVHLVSERLGWLLLSLLLLVGAHSTDVTAACLVLAMAIAYQLSVVAAPRGAEVGHQPLRLRELYRRSAAFGLLGLSSDLQQLDSTAAAGLAGVSVAAEVGVASKLTGPVGLVAGSISQVAFRGVARGGSEAQGTSRSALRASVALGLLVGAAAPLLPLLAVAALGGAYRHAGLTIMLYAFGTAVAVVNQPMAGMLTAAGHDRVVARLIAVSVVLGLVLGAATVRSWGAPGMAAGFVLTQVLIVAGCCRLKATARP